MEMVYILIVVEVWSWWGHDYEHLSKFLKPYTKKVNFTIVGNKSGIENQNNHQWLVVDAGQYFL